MSDSSTTNLTREQKEFLDECLTEFANRYSEDDEEYKKVYDQGIPKAPVFSPWHGRPRLTTIRSGNRNYQGRYDRDRDRYDNRESRYDSRDSRYERNYDRNRRGRDDGHNRYRPY